MSGLPFLRWAGSKRLLLNDLASYWNERFDRYIEPFAGSARLFFRLRPQRSILGDINTELLLTYRQVKRNPGEVGSQLDQWHPSKSTYYHLRSLAPRQLSAPARAARFIYLNRLCFNGLYRTNLKGEFNVPFGGVKAGTLPTSVALRDWAAALSGTKFVSGDFEVVLSQATHGDFVYLDPPFCVSNKRTFTEYDKAGFGRSDITRLRRVLCQLADKQVSFLVSYAESPEAVFLMKGFNCRKVSVKRTIAGFAGARKVVPELLISHRC